MGDPGSKGAECKLPRVLVVDDEPLALRGFTRCLRRHAEVVAASTFEEARAVLERGESYDAFVFDLNLDPGSGLDLLAFAREHGYPKTPAILVTGAEGNRFVNPAHALRADLLTKPFPPEQLREFVREAAAAAAEGAQRASSFPADHVAIVVARSRASLDECIEDLRKLFGLRQTWQVRHAIGSIINDMMNQPEVFGARAVSAAAAAVGQGVRMLYRHAGVAATWGAAETERLLSTKMGNGTEISWRHLIALAPVDDDGLREKLLAQAVEASLDVERFEALVSKARAGG